MMHDPIKEAKERVKAGSITILILVVVAMCVAMGHTSAAMEMRTQAVQRGVARYHPVTGEWEWTVPLIDSEACKIKNVEKLP